MNPEVEVYDTLNLKLLISSSPYFQTFELTHPGPEVSWKRVWIGADHLMLIGSSGAPEQAFLARLLSPDQSSHSAS
jgi:hypothetical protein